MTHEIFRESHPRFEVDAAEVAARLQLLDAAHQAFERGYLGRSEYKACRLVLAEGCSINEASRSTGLPAEYICEALDITRDFIRPRIVRRRAP